MTGTRGILIAVAVATGCHAAKPGYPSASTPVSFMPTTEPGRKWDMQDALEGLRFQNPVTAVQPPRHFGVWFIGEREGRIMAVPRSGSPRRAVTALDLRAHTLGWQDCGLLGLAFHPEFAKPGSPNRNYLYVWYNYTATAYPGPGSPLQTQASTNRLSRFTIPDGSLVADPASESVLIEQERTAIDHNGGGMFFHPEDGFLYLGVGDGGHPFKESRGNYLLSGRDETQKIDSGLFSGVLRIDVDRRGDGISHPIRRQPLHGRTQGYFIPDSNPWLDPGGGVLEEFFAIGLRNPHRMSFDPVTRRVFAGDVGESQVEEIDLIERGGNYQWAFREGQLAWGRRPVRVLGSERGPLFAYLHRGSASVVGGFVYRGRAYPELRGKYLFGDTATGEVWALDAAAAGPVEPALLLRLPREQTAYAGLASFAEDAEGEVYACILGQNERGNGTLDKLVRLPDSGRRAPTTLSATRLFRDIRTLDPDAALFPYEVNAPFWSDHAVKSRWLFVPAAAQVRFAAQGAWTFPAGTIAVKHFDLPLDEADPRARRRLETRVLSIDEQGRAYGRTYKWRPDGRDADLLNAPVTERLTIATKERVGPLHVEVSDDPTAGRDLEPDSEGGFSLESPIGGRVFGWINVDGDFDVAAAWERLEGGEGGLLVQGHPAPAPALFFVGWREAPSGRRQLIVEQRRSGGAVEVVASEPAGSWIRLRRTDGRLFAYSGQDGHLWQQLAPNISFGDVPDGTLGLSLSGKGAQVARARISRVVHCQQRDHYYPSNEECVVCHNASAHYLLGINTRQWNRDVASSPGKARTNQLLLARKRGLLDAYIAATDPPKFERLVALDDQKATTEDRVRSYLDANCSQCHQPGFVVGVGIDARYQTPLGRQGLIWGKLRWPTLPHVDEYIVAPRDPERSRLYKRLLWHDMPPLGNMLANTDAIDIVREWIMGLGGPPALPPVRIHWRYSGPTRANVELVHPDPAATLHYTTDDSAPSPETPRYEGPLDIKIPSTVRAAAFRSGFVRSAMATAQIGPPRQDGRPSGRGDSR